MPIQMSLRFQNQQYMATEQDFSYLSALLTGQFYPESHASSTEPTLALRALTNAELPT